MQSLAVQIEVRYDSRFLLRVLHSNQFFRFCLNWREMGDSELHGHLYVSWDKQMRCKEQAVVRTVSKAFSTLDTVWLHYVFCNYGGFILYEQLSFAWIWEIHGITRTYSRLRVRPSFLLFCIKPVSGFAWEFPQRQKLWKRSGIWNCFINLGVLWRRLKTIIEHEEKNMTEDMTRRNQSLMQEMDWLK